jgi:DNA-binding transcriptional LysR family regulator
VQGGPTGPDPRRAIKLLEEEFDGLLFHRERARTHLSELGQAVRPYLAEGAPAVGAGEANGHELHRAQANPAEARDHVHHRPRQFRRIAVQSAGAASRYRAAISDAGAADLQERLLAGELEAAIYCWPDQIDERLHYLPLFREQFFIVLGRRHRLAMNNAVRVSDLDGERYLNRINCEQVNVARDVFARQGTKVERVYRSDRDDWILAMVAAGLGFAFMPRYSITERADIVVRPLVEPEFWREVSLVTVRGRQHSPAIGALVREAMRTQRLGTDALAVQKGRAPTSSKIH